MLKFQHIFFVKLFHNLYIYVIKQNNKLLKAMKRIMPWAIVGIFLVSLASCGSSKAHCDAYGDNETKIEHDDLAQR